ncbi:MAG: cobalt-precorrin-6A reductase [Carbonactinosporaceae bacterium]
MSDVPDPGHVAILGGTTEARQLAAVLAACPGLRVTSLLAGRVSTSGGYAGTVRVGGFGGPAGLARWLREHDVDALVDATHPFADVITGNAARASAEASVPLVVVRRHGWAAGPEDRWHVVDCLEDAAAALPGVGARIFLTTGRQGMAAFAALDVPWFLVRAINTPAPPLPRHAKVLLARGPYTVEGETALLHAYRIDAVVTKDSGGRATAAKLVAARNLGLPVVVIRRPPVPDGLTVVPDASAVMEWLSRRPGLLSLMSGAGDTCP